MRSQRFFLGTQSPHLIGTSEEVGKTAAGISASNKTPLSKKYFEFRKAHLRDARIECL